MPHSLYFENHRFLRGGLLGEEEQVEFQLHYGIRHRTEPPPELPMRISLKSDLLWREVENLQRVMRGADLWTEFPEPDLRLISAEVRAGDEDQRIDLLYLRQDGGILPCELKVGGRSRDTHGQLIRYIADLNRQTIDREWVTALRRNYLVRKYSGELNAEQNVLVDLREFIQEIADIPAFQLLDRTGIIIDEGFAPALVTAVRYLNNSCGFSIRMIRADAHVANDWRLDGGEWIMRLDFNEVL